jgi:hypothetical protein
MILGKGEPEGPCVRAFVDGAATTADEEVGIEAEDVAGRGRDTDGVAVVAVTIAPDGNGDDMDGVADDGDSSSSFRIASNSSIMRRISSFPSETLTLSCLASFNKPASVGFRSMIFSFRWYSCVKSIRYIRPKTIST